MAMELGEINLTLESTTMPDPPGSLPIGCRVAMNNEAVPVGAERTGTIAGDISFEFEIPKDRIRSFRADLRPDVPDDFEYSPWKQLECPSITIYHVDPYGVVEEFATTFTSTKAYWIKALGKLLRERLNISEVSTL